MYPDASNLTNASFIYGNTVADDIARGAGHIFAAHLKETVAGAYREIPFSTGTTDYEGALSQLVPQGVRRFVAEMCTPATRTGKKILSLLPLTFAAKLIRRLRDKRPFCTCFGFLATDGT